MNSNGEQDFFEFVVELIEAHYVTGCGAVISRQRKEALKAFRILERLVVLQTKGSPQDQAKTHHLQKQYLHFEEILDLKSLLSICLHFKVQLGDKECV